MTSPDHLKQLDGPLLGKFWPGERAVMGLRVNRWVREQMQKNVQRVVMRCPRYGDCGQTVTSATCGEHLAKEVDVDLFQFQHSAVEIEIHASRSASYSILSGVASCLVRGWGGLITVIDLSNSSLKVDSFVQLMSILSKCRGLRHLDLGGNQINPDVFPFFSATLMGCTALTHLNLSRSQLGGDEDAVSALGVVLHMCKRLTHLILKDTNVDDECIAQLQGSLAACTNMQHLDLSCGHLTSTGAGKLAEVIQPWSHLSHLDLSNNSQLSVPRHHRGLEQLGASLSLSLELKTLLLQNCNLGWEATMRLLTPLSSSSRSSAQPPSPPPRHDLPRSHPSSSLTPPPASPGIAHLNLRGNAIGSADGSEVESSSSPSLRAESFLVHVSSFSQLQRLDVSDNNLAPASCSSLSSLFQHCPQLTHLRSEQDSDKRTVTAGED